MTWTSFKLSVKKNLLPIVLVLGIFLILLYFIFKYLVASYFNAHLNGFKELYGIALAILSSGIFLAVLKWFQFMGFFKEELENIIGSSQFDEKLQHTFHEVLYSDEFLKKQKNLDIIWKRVTSCLFKSEFPDEISDKINSKLVDVFFHNSKLSHYYRNYMINITVSLDENNFLHIKETTNVKVIRPNIEKFEYDFCYYIDKTDIDDKISAVNCTYIKIDSTELNLTDLLIESNNDKSIIKKSSVEVEGSIEYNISSEVNLIYNIATDYEYKFFSERIIDYIRVDINFSKNLNVLFVPIGNEDFEDFTSTPQNLVKVFNNLLLPEKGFRLIFIKN